MFLEDSVCRRGPMFISAPEAVHVLGVVSLIVTGARLWLAQPLTCEKVSSLLNHSHSAVSSLDSDAVQPFLYVNCDIQKCAHLEVTCMSPSSMQWMTVPGRNMIHFVTLQQLENHV